MSEHTIRPGASCLTVTHPLMVAASLRYASTRDRPATRSSEGLRRPRARHRVASSAPWRTERKLPGKIADNRPYVHGSLGNRASEVVTHLPTVILMVQWPGAN